MSFRTAEKHLAPAPAQLLLLRPMEVGELLDEAFDLYKRNFRLLFGIAVLVSVPMSMLAMLFPYSSPGMWVVRIVSFLMNIVTWAALTRGALDRLLNRETTIIAAYRQGLHQFFWVFIATILYALAGFVGLVLFIIPGIYVLLLSLLVLPVIVIERRGLAGVFGRPRQLSAGHMWRLVSLALGLFVLGLIISTVLGALVVLMAATGGVDLQHPPDVSSGGPGVLIWAAYLLVSALLSAAWTPFFTTAQLLLYLDLRIRREAYDLELLAEAAEARVAAARSSVPASAPLPGQVGP